MKNLVRTAAVAVLVASAPLVTATAAGAAQASCQGSRIEHLPVKTSGGSVYGYLDIYYANAMGVNCAQLNSYGNLRGVKKKMSVAIVSCGKPTSKGVCGSGNPYRLDKGTYSQYAGPVALPAKAKCIQVLGAISYKGSVANRDTGAFHCG